MSAPEMSAPQTSVPQMSAPARVASHRLPLRRPLDFSRRTIAVLFVLCLALASIPILTHPIPPLSDYVNHLARMHVIAALPHDKDLARFYALDWSILPNLMMDLVVPVIDRFTNIYLAGEIYTLICFALIVGGTLTLHRALFGQWSAIPLLAFPLLYNSIFLIGVMNYYFGIGLALFALAFWSLLRDKPWPWRFAVSTLFIVALFFCHLFAAGVYAVGILSFELARLFERRGTPLLPRLVDFVASGLPFAIIIPMLVASPTWGLSTQNIWEPQGKLQGVEFVINVYYDLVAFGLTAVVVLAAAWAIQHRLLRTAPLLLPLLLVSMTIYLAMPRVVAAAVILAVIPPSVWSSAQWPVVPLTLLALALAHTLYSVAFIVADANADDSAALSAASAELDAVRGQRAERSRLARERMAQLMHGPIQGRLAACVMALNFHAEIVTSDPARAEAMLDAVLEHLQGVTGELQRLGAEAGLGDVHHP